MRTMRTMFITIGLATILFVMQSCEDQKREKSTKTEEKTEKGKEYTAAYVCPMHCKGSGSDEAGTCPICGMTYVQNKEYKGEHQHQH